MQTGMEAAFDQFIDVRNQPDKYSALLSRNMEIDIAVDLAGFTTFGRTDICFESLADSGQLLRA